MRTGMRIVLGVLMLSALFGCDYLAQRDLKPGESTVEDVRKLLGRPEMIWEEKDGSQTLEFVRAPAGTATYMVDIGPDGKYRGMRNVLQQDTFDKVRPGMSTDEVRRLLGKPSETVVFKLKQEDVWSWRHNDATHQPKMFNVHFSLDGKVRNTSVSDVQQNSNKGP
jgi:outer membrane protein assembly factor BamE (lipoprotein component of BamABCDE complex)